MSFKKVRDAHKSENTEDYLEIIADLLNTHGEARIVDIANKLDIAQSTANKTIQRLQNQGFVKKEPYRSIFLTLKGQEVASFSKKRSLLCIHSIGVFPPIFSIFSRKNCIQNLGFHWICLCGYRCKH